MGLMLTHGWPSGWRSRWRCWRRGPGRLLLGIPTLRLRADYFAITTIAAGGDPAHRDHRTRLRDRRHPGPARRERALAQFNRDVVNLFEDIGWDLDRRVPLLVLVWLVALVVGLLLVYLASPWRPRPAGRARERGGRGGGRQAGLPLQAPGPGPRSGIRGLSGVLYTFFSTTLFPNPFEPILTFVGFAILILGGIGSYFGVVRRLDRDLVHRVGQRFLDFPIDSDKVAALRFVVIGLLIMAVMAFRPQGLFGKKEELYLDA